jgi:class 3 adenylate cyclase
VVTRAHAGELLATDRVVDSIEGRERLRADPIGEVTLKGFPAPTELFAISATPPA